MTGRHITCPACKKRIRLPDVPEEQLPQRGACSKCGAVLLVRLLLATQRPEANIVPPPSTAARPPAADKFSVVYDLIHWFGAGTKLAVGSFTLVDPHVYASWDGAGSRQSGTDPSEIVVNTEVRRPEGAAPAMGYWPSYSRIAPENRYQYLEWLASGRKALPPEEGLLFLFYYGLERRLFVDREDRDWVLREVVRLRKLDEPRLGTREGASFRRYSSDLLRHEVARAPQDFSDKSFAAAFALMDHWSEDTRAVALYWHAKQEQPLSDAMAQHAASLHSSSQQSVVTRRVGDEFATLFATRYRARYGRGLNVLLSKKSRRVQYRPASAALKEGFCEFPDPLGAPDQFGPLAEIWNSCVEDLRRLSKVADKGTGNEVTVKEWEAMPVDLRRGTDHPLSPRVLTLVVDGIRGEQECILPIGRLAALLEFEQRERLTAAQSRHLAETIEHTGYAIEPDARLSGRSYRWDDSVAVFLRTYSTPTEKERYAGAACMLQLGLAVAQADSATESEELRLLTQQVESVFQMPDHERRRLEALRAVLLKSGVEIGPVARKIEQTLPQMARQTVGRMLVAIATADGTVHRKEQSALRRCYRALGLAPELLEQTIAELMPAGDSGLSTVKRSTSPRDSGEPIPPPEEGGLRLNRDAISAIMSETREVAALLAAAMATDEPDDPGASSAPEVVPPPSARTVPVVSPAPSQPADGVSVVTTTGSSRPPARYAALYDALVSCERWPRADADALARSQGIMLSGAVEAINDWSFDALGGPLLEERQDELVVDRSLL